MANNLYVTSTEARSGKSAISLGIMEMLLRKIGRVAFFRPLVTAIDDRNESIKLISSHFNLKIPYDQMFGFTIKEAGDLVSHNRETELIDGIIKKYNKLKENCDFILCEGTDFESSTLAFELDINAEISMNLSCPVLLIANAYHKTAGCDSPVGRAFSRVPD